jgi:hypothetical protein
MFQSSKVDPFRQFGHRAQAGDLNIHKGAKEMEKTKVYPKRKGLKSGARTEFTVIGNVKPGHEQALREAIKRRGADPRRREDAKKFGTIHEARVTLIDNDTRLLFCSSFDGTWDKYIDDFAVADNVVSQSFAEFWSHVEGYPGITDPSVRDWLTAHQYEALAYDSSYPEPTVKQIWKALEVQHAFQQVLDHPEAEQALSHPALKPLLDQAAT